MTAQGIRGEHLLRSGARFSSPPGFFARLTAPGFATIIDRIDRGIVAGSVRALLPDGTTRVLGNRQPGFDVEVTLIRWRALVRLVTAGSIGWYQAYEAGDWEADDMTALFALFTANARTLGDTGRSSGPARFISRMVHRLNRNSRSGSARNIAAHYDLGNDFYSAWLDPTMTYSSAIAPDKGGLEAGQRRKLDAMAHRIDGANSVLEIGCGWGALARRLARDGAKVTAISLSDEQLSWARDNTPPNIADDIDFIRRDYRDLTGTYDAIVSVEMVEALGRENWPDFMDRIARHLRPGGRAAIQFISLADDLFESYARSVDFIQAFVFPGGMLIKASEFRALAQEHGLAWVEGHSFGHDYAKTLKAWRQSFDRAVAEGRLPQGFDARFVRLWRYYLSYCEGGFRSGMIDVHQVTLVKD